MRNSAYDNQINNVMRKEILEAEAKAFERMAGTGNNAKSIPDLPEPNMPSDLSLITLLIVVQVLMGLGCIIGGCIAASKAYDGAVWAVSGIVSGVFMFTLAVVTMACKKYLSK